MSVHLNKKEREKYECEICKKDYLYPSSLRKHQDTEHGDVIHLDIKKLEDVKEVVKVSEKKPIKASRKIEIEEEKEPQVETKPSHMDIEDIYRPKIEFQDKSPVIRESGNKLR